MMAANPSRVGGGFAETHLQALVETVTRVCNNALLQIVNYNVEGWQYVLAGELIALEVTTQVLNFVKKNNIKVAEVSQVSK
jgi:malonyl CoA-acyl carrier protein transacylase